MNFSYWIGIVLVFTITTPLLACSSELKCLNAPSGASESFGYSLAATDDVILVGDPAANVVWAFEEDAHGAWRASAIRPPSGSEAAALGRGFGRSVAIDTDGAIVIGAFVEEALGVAPRKKPGDGFRRLGEIFVARDIADPVMEVPGLDVLADTEAFGFSVTRTGRHVAIGLRVIAGDQYGTSSVLLVDLASGAQIRVTAPTSESANDFGYALASAGGMLVIGAPSLAPAGGGVIYDLEIGAHSVIAPPQKTPRTGFSVATDGAGAVFGGEATVIADNEGDAWVITHILTDEIGTVVIDSGRVVTLRGASRVLTGAMTATPPLEISVIENGSILLDRLAPPGNDANGRWPHRALAMKSEFVVIGRPTETKNCKVIIISLKK